jgi:hypothetical protein
MGKLLLNCKKPVEMDPSFQTAIPGQRHILLAKRTLMSIIMFAYVAICERLSSWLNVLQIFTILL